jgi:hypothetical protein
VGEEVVVVLCCSVEFSQFSRDSVIHFTVNSLVSLQALTSLVETTQVEYDYINTFCSNSYLDRQQMRYHRTNSLIQVAVYQHIAF